MKRVVTSWHTRRNVKGRRSRLNKVREVKMIPGSSSWPKKEYVVKDRTDASTGSGSARLKFAERTSNRERIYLQLQCKRWIRFQPHEHTYAISFWRNPEIRC